MASGGQMALAGAPATSLRPPPRQPERRVQAPNSSDAIIAATGLTGQVGFVVADARTGRILESRNAELGLPPASVAKALTAQYALEMLGPTYSFKTRLVATGPVRDGRLEGDLILAGGGDPTLDTNALADMATALKSAGVKSVAGQFLVDSGALPTVPSIDATQPGYLGYNPTVSGINLNYNRVYFEWKKTAGAYIVTLDARSEKYRPDVTVARIEIVDRASPVYTYDSQNNVDQWTVARRALGNQGARWLPVRHPDRYAGEVFQTFARTGGIVLKPVQIANGPVDGTVLVERGSKPLQSILQGMLKYSTNLTAEVVGLAASQATGRKVLGLRGSADAMNQWMDRRFGAEQVGFVDHSGLGGGSRISTQAMVTSLLRLGPDSALASILKPLPMRDIKGNVLNDSGIIIKAKTGTLNFVSCLAGFIENGPGSDLVFAVFAADLDRRAAIRDADRERPRGAKGWNNQARRLQRALLEHWTGRYRA